MKSGSSCFDLVVSQPPSSDGLAKPAPMSLRRGSKLAGVDSIDDGAPAVVGLDLEHVACRANAAWLALTPNWPWAVAMTTAALDTIVAIPMR